VRRDGRWDPFTAIAQAAAVTTVLIVWASHEVKRRFRAVDPAQQAAAYQALTAGRVITGPSQYRP
jgi:hypothetical protein